MKILHVIHSLDPRSGGPSNTLRALAAAQAEAGDDVTILATDVQSAEPWLDDADYRGKLSLDERLQRVRVEIVKGIGRKGALRRFRYSREAAPRLREMMLSRRPDVIHIHGLFSHLTTCAARIGAAAHVPHVMRPAGGLNEFCRAQGNRAGKNALFHLFVKRDLESALFVHATSEREAEELRRILPEARIEVIPHGVEIPSQEELDSARALFLSSHLQLKDQRLVLYLSRIDRKKRLDLVVRAMAEAPLAAGDVALVIAGSDAGFRAEVERLVRELQLERRVFFVGFLEGMMKSGAFAAANVFALTSEDENFGAAAVEALAHGTPTVLTRGVDSHAYSEAAGAGVTVDATPSAIADGIARMLREDRTAMAAAGRRHAQEKLSWKEICARLRAAYCRMP